MIYSKIIQDEKDFFSLSKSKKKTGEKYFSMPKLNLLDDYDECMDSYKDDAKYCYVKSIIKPPAHPSVVFDYIKEFSSNVKQHYRHDKLVRGICLNKCAKLVKSLNISIDHYYQPPFGTLEPKVWKYLNWNLKSLHFFISAPFSTVHFRFCKFSKLSRRPGKF